MAQMHADATVYYQPLRHRVFCGAWIGEDFRMDEDAAPWRKPFGGKQEF